MTTAFLIIWAALIFASIAWYGFLVFYVGLKAGRDIRTLIRHREDEPPSDSAGA